MDNLPMDPTEFRSRLVITTSHGRRPLNECLDPWLRVCLLKKRSAAAGLGNRLVRLSQAGTAQTARRVNVQDPQR